MGKQGRTGHAFGDGALGQGGNHHALTGWMRVLGPHILADKQTAGHIVELLGNLLPDLFPQAGVHSFGLEHDLLAGQMGR